MNLIIGLIIFVALLAIWFISVGNRLNRYLVTIEESKRTVDIVLVKRYDTISEMLKVAYAKHEQQIFTDLVALRQGATIQESNQVITNQNDVLAQIRAVGENYPELLSSNQFLALQKEIAGENEDLAAAKRIVNSNVSHINQEIVSFPASIVAGVKGIHQVPFLAEETQGKKDLSDLNYDLN